jgi:beta-glucosidase
VAYPFGFGLSYSSFAHSDAAAVVHRGAGEGAWVELLVSVRNSGERAAAEVVQVYLEPPGVAMERPRRSLVAFKRVSLEPGEMERLSLPVPLRRLACFDADRDSFVVEAGLHRLVVAPHAEAVGLTVVLELEASVLGP